MIPDDLAAELPAPRDDEPAALRGDIVDELADHLHSLWQAELLRGGLVSGDETGRGQAAWDRTLERFGEPRSLARELWFKAMWSRIMNQRLQWTMLGVLTLTSLALLAMTWQSLAASRQLASEAQATNAALLKQLQSPTATSEMLQQMQALFAERRAADTAVSAAASEFSRLRVKCVRDQMDGVPVPNASVTCTPPGNTHRLVAKTLKTGPNGVADIGLVPYGGYYISVTIENNLTMRQMVSLYPGETQETVVVCPSPDATGQLSLSIKNPPDVAPPEWLKGRIWYVVRLERREQDYNVWLGGRISHLLISPDGRIAAGSEADPKWAWERINYPGGPRAEVTAATMTIGRFASRRLRVDPAVSFEQPVALPPNEYYISGIDIAVEENSDAAPKSLLVFGNEIPITVVSAGINERPSGHYWTADLGSMRSERSFSVLPGKAIIRTPFNDCLDEQIAFLRDCVDNLQPVAVDIGHAKPKHRRAVETRADLHFSRSEDNHEELLLVGARVTPNLISRIEQFSNEGTRSSGGGLSQAPVVWMTKEEVDLIEILRSRGTLRFSFREPSSPDEPRGSIDPKFRERFAPAASAPPSRDE